MISFSRLTSICPICGISRSQRCHKACSAELKKRNEGTRISEKERLYKGRVNAKAYKSGFVPPGLK